MSAPPVIVTYHSRWVFAAGLLVGLAFVAQGVLILRGVAPGAHGFQRWYEVGVGWFCGLSGAALFTLTLPQIVNPTRLVVTDEGFGQVGFWRLKTIPWQDIASFELCTNAVRQAGVWTLDPPSHVACYRLTEAARTRAPSWRRWVAPGKNDGVLTSGPGSRPREVIDLLCEHLRRARSRH